MGLALASANMDRLPHLTNTQKKFFCGKQHSPSAGTTPAYF
jgi:hypothetical protein